MCVAIVCTCVYMCVVCDSSVFVVFVFVVFVVMCVCCVCVCRQLYAHACFVFVCVCVLCVRVTRVCIIMCVCCVHVCHSITVEHKRKQYDEITTISDDARYHTLMISSRMYTHSHNTHT